MGRVAFSVILIFSLILAGSLGFAEVYKYRDDKGQIHYTNSLADIPKQYLKSINTEQEIQYSVPEASAEAEAKETRLPAKPSGTASPEQKRQAALQADINSLKKKRKDLDRQRNLLDSKKETIKTQAELTKYNQDVNELNQAYKRLSAQEKELQQKIHAYNKDLKKNLEEKLEKINKMNERSASESQQQQSGSQ
ncbi:MAG: DUF4124 domain-containing protein [Thermodesulfobacteriota bacterium]|nr:DUF4124 domain-containing protein [Thermodesulfobacteriota bacterium]